MTEKQTVNRSKEVRERRSREQDKRHKQAAEKAYRTMPPVTTRDRGWEPFTKSSKKANVRRYHSAAAVRSVGSRLPAFPALQVGPRIIPLVLTLLLGAALYFLLASPTFRVTQAQVNGLTRLSAAEVNSALGLGGRLVFFLKPEDIINQLRVSYPEIASAQVNISLPDQVVLDVKERQPVLLWQQGSGYTWIDETGVAFRPSGDVTGLVQVAALGSPPGGPAPANDLLSPASYVAPDLVKTALALAPSMPQGSAMTYDPTSGFGWTDSRGWQVFFGTGSKDAALKLQIYQSLVDSLNQRGIAPVYISVVHADAPYYRMEK